MTRLAPKGPVGEAHFNAKATEATVREMRELWETGYVKLRELAEMFDMTISGVHHIVRHRRWKQVK